MDYYLETTAVYRRTTKKSDAEVADAMFAKGFIFKDNWKISWPTALLKNFNGASATTNVVETLFQCYLMASKEKTILAEAYRNRILTAFPNSKMAQLKDPDYIRRQGSMFAEQDSFFILRLMQHIHAAIFPRSSKIRTIFVRNIRLLPLLPKFEFLNALSIGKQPLQLSLRNL